MPKSVYVEQFNNNSMTKKVEKKKVILTLCKVFPVTHQRAKQPTGFEEKLNRREKIHTIRGNNKGVWDNRYADIASGGKYLSIREWEGTDDAVPQAWVDDRQVPVEELAKNDGLSVEDFVNWFFGSVHQGNVFEGVVIHFTDFRY